MGGILIRVNRAECEGRTNEHVSETALDDFNGWDYVIENNGTIEELIGQVRTILEKEGIIKKGE
jgi:dephospho-CoA kinase